LQLPSGYPQDTFPRCKSAYRYNWSAAAAADSAVLLQANAVMPGCDIQSYGMPYRGADESRPGRRHPAIASPVSAPDSVADKPGCKHCSAASACQALYGPSVLPRVAVA